MLVLSRKNRGTVKLGIDAPPEVRVVRGEIANRTGPETLAEVIERLDLMGTTGH